MFKNKALIKAAIGETAYNKLAKAISKQDADAHGLESSLKMVPRSIVALLTKELSTAKHGDKKDLNLPVKGGIKLSIQKLGDDKYGCDMSGDGKDLHSVSGCSIPQLSAHVLSHFGLFDTPTTEDSSNNASDMKRLEQKIDALFALVMSQNKVEKSELKDIPKKANKLAKVLKKAGLAPKMPTPPKAGSKVGGMNGIAQTGIHSMKTMASDSPRSKVTGNLDAKNAKKMFNAGAKSMAAAVKPASTAMKSELTVAKSEIRSTCGDCGQKLPHCACFQALSEPELIKSSNDTVTYKFQSDWSKEAVSTLYKTICRRK